MTRKKTPPKTKAASKPETTDETTAETKSENQLEWEGGDNNAPGAEDATTQDRTPLTRRQILALPRVEDSVNAQNLNPNCVCVLTPGCRGRITVYTTHRKVERDDEGKPKSRITEQYVKCNKCGRAPVNPRRLIQPLVDTKLFNRHKVKQD